jgi:uroporphyrinogen-III decarboxylase
LPELAGMAIDILDLDWMVRIGEARGIMGDEVTLCGNFNPVTEQLQCDAETTRAACVRCQKEGGIRFILQGGCETPPGTPEENIRACFV